MNPLLKQTKPLMILALLLSFNVIIQHTSCNKFANEDIPLIHKPQKMEENLKIFAGVKITKQPSPPSGPNHGPSVPCFTPPCA